MPSLFRALSARLGFNDGYQSTNLVDAIPTGYKSLRLNSNASIFEIRLLNVKPNSDCILKLNGHERTRFTANEKGEARAQFDQDIDLSRFHRVQIFFETANSMPVLYGIA